MQTGLAVTLLLALAMATPEKADQALREEVLA